MNEMIIDIPPGFVSQPLFAINEDGAVISCNNPAVNITSLKEHELIGRSFNELFDDHNKAGAMLWEVFEKGKVSDFLLTFKKGNNEGIDVLFEAFCPVTSGEVNKYALASASVIKINSSTEEKKIEKIVKEIADYKYALDESSIVAITDQRGIIKHVNDNFCTVSKYKREELLGNDHRIINSGFHSKEFIRNLWHTIASGNIWKGELKNKAKDGTIYWVNTTIIPFLNESGKPYQYVSIREDITSRKKIEEQQILYQQIIRSCDDAIISTDLAGVITSWNRGAEHIFDYTAEEALGKNISILRPEEKKGDQLFILEKVRKGESVNHYETIRKKKYGAGIFISLTVSPIRNSTGDIIGISKIARDISERKRIEREIKKLNDELELRVKERTEEMESFSYSVSHDLRAPLRAVNGYAKILEEDYNNILDKEGQRLLGEVQQNARKMGTLIDDLLAFSRLGRKAIEKSLIDMNKLTEAAIREIEQSTKHNAAIKFEGLIPVMADYSLFQHVMINLISNAIKYSSLHPKPVIEIQSVRAGSEIIYSIKDNGVGFSMDYVHKLFGVFQRLHSHDEFPGTGVGLAIVQRIIHKHNGRVWAEGKLNEEATFYFSLPSLEN